MPFFTHINLLEQFVAKLCLYIYKVTPFLHHRFLRDLTVKKDIIKCYCFPFLSFSLFIVFYLIKGHLSFSTTGQNGQMAIKS